MVFGGWLIAQFTKELLEKQWMNLKDWQKLQGMLNWCTTVHPIIRTWMYDLARLFRQVHKKPEEKIKIGRQGHKILKNILSSDILSSNNPMTPPPRNYLIKPNDVKI